MVGVAARLKVTPNTEVHRLATAIVTEHRKVGGVVLTLNPKQDKVIAIAAKALGTIPHVAHDQDVGESLACVVRWPTMQRPEGGKFIYAHILDRRGPIARTGSDKG